MRVIIANIIFIVTAIVTFALMLFTVFGIATLIKGLPGILTNSLLCFVVVAGFGTYFLINYLVLKCIKRRFRVTDEDISNNFP
jgi:hypothetical protein